MTDAPTKTVTEIKHRWTGKTLFSYAGSVREAVIEALRTGANLRGANLSCANLSKIRYDFFSVLNATPGEVDGLRATLFSGKVNGSTYEGECACLVGTIAHVRGCNYEHIDGLKPDSTRPIERFFLAIRPGYTPENHQVAKVVAGWIDEWRGHRAGPDTIKKYCGVW
jgi:hypothetical protein